MTRKKRGRRLQMIRCRVLHLFVTLSLHCEVTIDFLRFAMAEDDTIIQSAAESAIDSEFYTDGKFDTDEKSIVDNIILMSMHEIDPLEEHIVAAMETSSYTDVPARTLDSISESSESKIDIDIDTHENIEDDKDQDVDEDNIDDDKFEMDDANATTKEDDEEEEFFRNSEGRIDFIPDDAGFDKNRTTETINVNDCKFEENQTTDHPSLAINSNNRSASTNNNDFNTSTSSNPTSLTTGSDTKSYATNLETTTMVSEDDRSLLDMFAESAKVYLTQQMVRRNIFLINSTSCLCDEISLCCCMLLLFVTHIYRLLCCYTFFE